MPHRFFPEPTFGWVYYGLLVAFLAVASFTDLRALRIPNPLTVAMLFTGLVLNIARGAWLGAEGTDQGVWVLGPHGSLVGGLDGLLWGLAGFATGFGLFFLMWMLRTCGGGDVKLFGAVGAWVGPLWILFLLAGTVIMVVVFGIARRILVALGLSRPLQGWKGLAMEPGSRQQRHPRVAVYAPAVLVSASILLLWFLGPDLGLRTSSAQTSNTTITDSH
jgi:prepilin peptidase CpaA